ncbi:MAG: aquaporin [Planctomycetes bacterium]|nr:aquaporin [Planctomycetota bacterium]
MDKTLPRILIIELIGAFGLVFFSSGLICVNQMTLASHQLGVLGIALGQGLILAAMLALTAPATGGYLNPAITLMLWVFGRVETQKAAGFMAVQFAGSILAAVCLYFTFDASVLGPAQFGAPHLNTLAYPTVGQGTLFTGAVLELVLTFFLVFAIFGLTGGDALKLGIVAGMIATVCALFGFALTGACMNPARWLGPTLLEAFNSTNPPRSPWTDSAIYLGGPIVGALVGGFVSFKVFLAPEK